MAIIPPMLSFSRVSDLNPAMSRLQRASMACVVMAYVAMAYVVMAYIVMAYVAPCCTRAFPKSSHGPYSYGLCSYGPV